jgi:hypothetical protein
MDAVTYPDSTLREITKEFVCIRVDFDRNQDIAKKYGVQPLADLRLLDPDGKQSAKLIGFSSASRLSTACRAELDRLAGKAPAESTTAGTSSNAPIVASKEAIAAAVERGRRYLIDSFGQGSFASSGVASLDQALFACAACGINAKAEDLQKLLRSTCAAPLTSTYQAAFRALALASRDPEANRDGIEACARFLVGSQLSNGQWSYNASPEGAQPPALGDNSNTAYAILGLAACRRAGVDVPQANIERAQEWWRSAQREDGGFGYRTDREKESYASMTASGLSSLVLCEKLLARDQGTDAALDRARAWLLAHFSVSENTGSAYQQGRLLYHLYALERVGTLLGVEKLGTHDWYAEGASYLLRTQNGDGSWDDGADTPLPNTSFALLFLTRSSMFLR